MPDHFTHTSGKTSAAHATAYTNVIDADALATLQKAQVPLVVLDCSFDLADAGAGRRAYDEGHIEGAHYVHLDESLSGAKTGTNGRHPLPDRDALVQTVASLGIDNDTQVVAYDNAAGMYAARLWWLMRWLGHDKVAVLDGGVAEWKAQGRPLTAQASPRPTTPGAFTAKPSLTRTVDHDALRANLETREKLVVDARAPDRFRGENETIDPVGGHIPGARNHFFRLNLTEAGLFREPQALREAYDSLIEGFDADHVVMQCGSGVTACHNLLAMDVAGIKNVSLYPGSWSEWCKTPGAPVATTS